MNYAKPFPAIGRYFFEFESNVLVRVFWVLEFSKKCVIKISYEIQSLILKSEAVGGWGNLIMQVNATN